MQQPFFIVGPTAVGKTGVAVKLAERCDAEIVNADAFQIYEGFDLLTAQPTVGEQARVRHHMLSCVAPARPYNVAQYLDDARACIARIHQRGKRVIVAGGNGLYVKALTHGLSPLPSAQQKIRSQLEQLSNTELLTKLSMHDTVTAATIDANNKRRLVRALEVCLATGKPFSSFQTQWSAVQTSSCHCGVFLSRERDDLVARINKRVEIMLRHGGVEEVRKHSREALSITAARILGLNDIYDYIDARCSLETCQEKIKVATRRYAKRQITWFKRETCFQSIGLSGCDEEEVLDKLQVIAFLSAFS